MEFLTCLLTCFYINVLIYRFFRIEIVSIRFGLGFVTTMYKGPPPARPPKTCPYEFVINSF